MAGEGIRFKNAGYNTPKPLLPLRKSLMFEKVIENFPSCDKWVFSVNTTIAESVLFNNFLKKFQEDYEVIIFEKLTDGQATTCYESLKDLEESDSVFIGSCDTIFENKIDLDRSKGFDFTIFTSSPTNLQNKNPKSYGWVQSKSSEKNIFCKENITLTDNSNIILGYFYFDSVSLFNEGYEFIKEKKLYVNGELYIDVITRELLIQNYKVFEHKVKSNIVGTPKEYELYLENER
jgi:NDP-sugar pyrophosphorylase family protein